MSSLLEVVAAAIRDSEGRYLMAQKNISSSQPLHWEFPGGKLEPGETQQQALCREIQEELNITISIKDLLAEVTGEVNKRWIRLSVWECLWDQSQKICLNEHVEVRWFWPREMSQLLMGPLDFEIVKFFTVKGL